MLIKFFGGTGGGGGIASYLVDPEREGREEAAPEVLSGDIDQTRALIDSQDRKWTYSTGVLSFAPEDRPTDAQQRQLMNDFERLAFAGLRRDQYDITWVRHSHTSGGRVELHFLTPRMELASGKAFNIAPPGWEQSYAPLRDAYNYEYGWARPDDPARSRSLQWATERQDRTETRETISSYLEGAVVTGQVTDRETLVTALYEAGFETPRLGKSYVTALNPETGERWRLKGRIYEQDWTRSSELDRPFATERGETAPADRGGDPERARTAREQLEAVIERRREWVEARFGEPTLDHRARGEDTDDRDQPGSERDQSETKDDDHDQRADHSDDDSGVLDRADVVDDVEAAKRDRAADTGRDVSDPANDSRDGLEMRQQSLREAGGLDNEQSDPNRAGALARIRELGRNIRGFGAAALAAVRSFFRKDRSAEQPADAARDAVDRSERSVDAADRVNERLDQQNAAVDRKLELISERNALEAEMECGIERLRERQITR